MAKILIVGGGFAGVWSAAAAVRLARTADDADAPLSVTLVSASADLVIRPRLYEAAPETMRIPLARILGPIGVRPVAATATDIDTVRKAVRVVTGTGREDTIGYDRLVLTSGSQLVRPPLPGAELMFDVDTLPAATALDAHIQQLPSDPQRADRFTAVVVGAGFTGLEVATELVDRLRAVAAPLGLAHRVRVVLVERADAVGPELGAGPRPQIRAALTALGVEQRLAVALASVDDHGVTLSDGARIAADTVVWTGGVEASPLTAAVPAARDGHRRLEVDEHLRVAGVTAVYAAGDTAAAIAEPGHRVTQSCQHASSMGKFAGHNAAADLLGLPLASFAPVPYVTCLDLGSAGAVFTTGWERTVVASHQEAKQRKREINRVWIYPPTDSPDELLRRADHRVAVRQSS